VVRTFAPLGWAALDKTTVYYYRYFVCDFTVYTFDMSAVSGWTGTITRLLFGPAMAPGEFGIDWIRIASAG